MTQSGHVAQVLEGLAQHGWTVLHDVHWPGRAQARIDHVAIGPGGIAVIDARYWTGVVTLTDGVLRQNGHRRDRELEGAANAVSALTALLAPQHRSAGFGVICLVGLDQEAVSAGLGLRVVGRAQLASFLAGLPPRLSPYDVADLGRRLSAALAGSSSPSLTAAAAAYAAVSPSSGRPERSAQAHVRRRPARARPHATVGGPGWSSGRPADRPSGRAGIPPRWRRGRRGGRAGARLLGVAVGTVLVVVFVANAPDVLEAISSLITSGALPTPTPTAVPTVPAAP
ncbi:nuclease-related domain-containing protein [Pengzhenrongella frigida]|uniref:nuclease-related domain-containing protein n=1 Tax=Pengzhenrongella frigida TaxID=1259133 RepID=UPI0013EB1FA4|nr:nuclease-related domain-containing protein [Cellulomonas sp. HLT2-17]